jgi:predicted Zn-ribbon and HTH transcriptional regulator
MIIIIIIMHHCDKCGHNWTARVENPQVCPRCKRYLNAPKKEKKEPEVINV